VGLFKQKIYFTQFLADLITFQFDLLEKNFDKLFVLADEFKVLTKKDKEHFLDKAHELVIVDIIASCHQQFINLSGEEIGKAVGRVYGQFLIEYKKLPEAVAEIKIEKVMKLGELVEKAEEDTQKRDEHYKKIGYKSYPKIDDDIDKQKFYLCSSFAQYCAGKDMKAENWEGKHFAAFKLAKGFVKGDIVANSLKHYAVTF